MANIKSQIKRNRQNDAAHERNKAARSALKTKIKKFVGAAESGGDNANELYVDVAKSLDQAAAKGIIHKNKAANQKSRLAKKLG